MTKLIEFRKENVMTTGEAWTAKDALDKAMINLIRKFEEDTEASVVGINIGHKESVSGRPLIKELNCMVRLCGFEQ